MAAHLVEADAVHQVEVVLQGETLSDRNLVGTFSDTLRTNSELLRYRGLIWLKFGVNKL